jgi:tetratricopeptide (TPR) repeat protein
VAIDREKVLAAAQKYVEKKRYDKAVVEYQRVIQEDPNDARTLLKIGDLQSKMEAYADAVTTYERVGKFYGSQGFALKAIAVYKQIREIVAKHLPQLEDKYSHITPKLADLYQQLGLTSDALAALDEVATRLQRQNRDAEAIQVFKRIVELDPTNPLPHLRLAEALSRVKDIDTAVHEFATAAAQLVKLGRRDDGIKVFERLLHHKADPVHARLAAEQYLARSQPNDGLQALAKLQICFQANPRDLDTLGLLSKAFNQIGQAAKAIEVQKEMARIARDSGKSGMFRELLTRLHKLAPNDEGVRQLTMTSSAPAPPSLSQPPAPVITSRSDAPDTQSQELGEYEGIGETEQTIDGGESSYEDVGDSDIESEDSYESSESAIDRTDQGDSPFAFANAPPSERGLGDHEKVVRILAEAASFRRARLPDRAVATLRVGLEVAPQSREVHEMLRDVLLDVGQGDEAVGVMLGLASLEVDNLDGEGAARTLQDVLALDPQNARALEMLRELGYELVEEPASSVPEIAPDEFVDAEPLPSDGTGPQAYDPHLPLPSYDLEEIGPEDVSIRSYSDPSIRTATNGHKAFEAIDDPFGEAPLPSFPLESPNESEASLAEPAAAEAYSATRLPSNRTGALELESALEEAEFFASRGLFEDARTILQEQLARLPNHPLLLERLGELEAQERGIQGGSGTRPSPSADGGEVTGYAEDRSFDIAESLGGLDPADLVPEAGFGAPIEQVDVEEVFAKFKEGVAKQIGVDDGQSHYDLGVAYKEMALLEDAIREFETAALDPQRECVCRSMIGMIQIERGNLNEAIDAFTRALQAPDCTKDQEAALSYEIGSAYESKRMNKQALDYFQRAARNAPGFRDVQERIRRLQPASVKPMRAAVGADDEFDRAFDDIMGGGKQP